MIVVHRSPKPELIPELLREQWIVESLKTIFNCGLNREDINKLLDAFQAHAAEISTANDLRRGACCYPNDPALALRCPYITEEERELWSNGKKPPRIEAKARRGGFIYLMRNQRNGFIKIGFSANPKHREKTLQSEEPEIKLLCKWEGTLEQEATLHISFRHQRIRGEWFNLTAEDIRQIERWMSK